MSNQLTKTNKQSLPISIVSRREFLAGASAAGALVLMAKTTSAGDILVAKAELPQHQDFSPDLFIAIQPNGDVTIMAHRSEMGTGIKTSLPRVVADELDADWNRVTIKQAPGDQNYGSQNTDGSNSVRGFFDRMRAVGAKARMMLEQAAANKWGVEVAEVKADFHKIVHPESGRQAGYGELVEAAGDLEVPDKKDLRFKNRDQWRYIGKAAKSVDLDDIVTGKAIYGVDAKMANMLYALIKRPPVVGGKVASMETEKAKQMPGVVDVIELPKYKGMAPAFNQLGGVAVLAETTWQAWQARDEIKVQWDHGKNGDYNTKLYKQELKKSISKPGTTVREVGNVAKEFKDAEKKFAVGYSVPHLAHAPMEVPAAVASVEKQGGKAVSCRILAATQNPQTVQSTVAKALKIPAEDVRVEVTLLGSGFGRKSKPDYCVEAALLAEKVGRPVHVMFTREDDIRHDYYHTMSEMHLEAAVNEQGMPTAWLGRVAYPSIGSTFNPGATMPGGAGQGFQDIPFDIPNIQVEICKAIGHVRIGWLRAVNHIHQNFAVSSFVDELAHHADRNPKDYLLDLLGEDRHLTGRGIQAGGKFPYDIGRLKAVTRRAAELADWDARYDNLPKGTGLGIACARSFTSYAAHVFEVNISKQGELKVKKVWVVLDAGTVVSPDRVKAQMEGTIAMTMGQTLFGKITFADGRCEQSNYDNYKMALMAHYPREIVTEIVESDGPPSGVGESTVASAAPALCNAIFSATGKRVRDLPLEDHDLSWS